MEDEIGMACSMNGEKGKAYRILVEKPEGERQLGRSKYTWIDNIDMNLTQTSWDGKDWIDLAQDRDQWRALVNIALNLLIP
jgi:ribonucleotide reductase beta subunit family protein with ferritin-like domain